MANKILILGGLGVVAAGLGYYLYTKNKAASAPIVSAGAASSPAITSGSSSVPTSSAPVGIGKQTLWKDADGNIFELKSTGEDKYGFPLLVNGGGNSKAITATIGADGHIITTNKQNETWTYKGGKWNKLSGLNGLGFMMQPGSGLGNAFALN